MKEKSRDAGHGAHSEDNNQFKKEILPNWHFSMIRTERAGTIAAFASSICTMRQKQIEEMPTTTIGGSCVRERTHTDYL